MAQTKITIEGLDEALRWAEKAPENCIKATRAALREASRVESRKLRQRIPKRWRKLVKYAVTKSQEGKLKSYVGMFNGNQVEGHQDPNGKPAFDWFKAYWANYGTLTHRDPNHSFREPIKNNKRRRNNMGQPRQNFYEVAIGPFVEEFSQAFTQAFAKQQSKLMER